MANFTFSLGDKTVYATVESARSSEFTTYRARGRCPFCLKEMTVGFGMGLCKTEAKARGDLKSSMKSHYRIKHK
jgi:hypothetical protein